MPWIYVSWRAQDVAVMCVPHGRATGDLRTLRQIEHSIVGGMKESQPKALPTINEQYPSPSPPANKQSRRPYCRGVKEKTRRGSAGRDTITWT
jgi:hypothetical protein